MASAKALGGIMLPCLLSQGREVSLWLEQSQEAGEGVGEEACGQRGGEHQAVCAGRPLQATGLDSGWEASGDWSFMSLSLHLTPLNTSLLDVKRQKVPAFTWSLLLRDGKT